MLQPLLAYADRTHPKCQTLRKRRRRGRVSVYFSFFSLLSSLISSLMLISGACLQKSFWWLIWSQSLLSLLCVSPLCCKNILHCLHQPAGGSTALRQSDGKRDHKPSKRGFSCWMKTIREEQEHTHTHTHTHTLLTPPSSIKPVLTGCSGCCRKSTIGCCTGSRRRENRSDLEKCAFVCRSCRRLSGDEQWKVKHLKFNLKFCWKVVNSLFSVQNNSETTSECRSTRHRWG